MPTPTPPGQPDFVQDRRRASGQKPPVLTPYETKRKERYSVKGRTYGVEVATGRKSWPIPGTGIVVRIEEYDVLDGNLNVWVSATRKGEDFMSDSHLVYVNPPVPGTGPLPPGEVRKTYRDLLEMMITETVMEHIRHKI
jgi:hypothetical protein